MIARIKNVYVSLRAFIWRLDRWLLLRAPMLWRTRLPYLLVLLSLAVIAALTFMRTSIKRPIEAADLGSSTMICWWSWLIGAVSVLFLWVRSINKTPVGELAPHRHIVTVVAVAIGSYLWLVMPSLLAYPRINAIKQVELDEADLKKDFNLLSQYSDWRCVPPDVWNNESELNQLRAILARYHGYEVEVKKGQIEDLSFAFRACHAKGDFPVASLWLVDRGNETIGTIKDARSFLASNYDNENQFYNTIGIGLSWWVAAAALGIGILTAILSYPRYVWRRTFGRN
jgi:hypothetical protein